MIKTFQTLQAVSDFRRGHMSFLQTIEDVELVREIGLSQARGHPMSLRILHARGYASTASIQRRLNRLKRLGVVEQKKAAHDGRVVHLTLSATVWKLYARLGREMQKTLK